MWNRTFVSRRFSRVEQKFIISRSSDRYLFTTRWWYMTCDIIYTYDTFSTGISIACFYHERWLKFSPMGLFSRETTHREDETLNFLNIFNRSSFQTFSSRSKISFHDISYSHIIIISVFWTILCNNRIIIIIKPFKRVSPDDKTLSNRLD